MRTCWSHDDTARKSAVGQNLICEMLSVGGDFSSMSLERSPCEGVVEDAPARPKTPAIVTDEREPC
jgi:hypothetical protein